MVFASWKDCIENTGLSREFLRLAKAKNAPGFNRSSGSARIDWDQLQPWIKAHGEELEQLINVSLEDLEKIKLQEDIIKTQLQNKKLQGEYLDPTEVADFLTKLRLAFESTVKGWISEIPAKLVGKSQGEIEHAINNEVNVFLTNFKNLIKEQCLKQ